MAEVFYAPRAKNSRDFTSFVLNKFYELKNVRFYSSRHGKPFCDAPVFFSVSHTKRLIFLCVSGAETGIDAEETTRLGNFVCIKNKLSPFERALANSSNAEFLKLWTRREATAKYLDVPVFASFSRLTFQPENNPKEQDDRNFRAESTIAYLNGKSLPVNVCTFELSGHFVSVCLSSGETVKTVKFIENF